MSSSDLKELLGDDRAKASDDWSDEEQAKVDAAQTEKGRENFNEKVEAPLAAIETGMDIEKAVYVSSGVVYGRGEEEGEIVKVDVDDAAATGMVTWPIAHNVRPKGWSLGAGGCTDCHSDDAKIFASTFASVGPGPDRGETVTMAQLQGVDPDQRLSWNEMFKGRANFKYAVAGSIAVLLMVLCIGIGAMAGRLIGRTV